MSIHDDWPGTTTYPYSCDTLCQCWSSWWEAWHLTWSYINGCCWIEQVSSGLGEWVWSTVKKQGTLSLSLMGLAWITVVHIEPRKFGHKTLQNQKRQVRNQRERSKEMLGQKERHNLNGSFLSYLQLETPWEASRKGVSLSGVGQILDTSLCIQS